MTTAPRVQPKLSELSPSPGKRGILMNGKIEIDDPSPSMGIVKFPHRSSVPQKSDLPHVNTASKLKPLMEINQISAKTTSVISPLVRRPKTRFHKLSDGAILHNVITNQPHINVF